MPLAGFEPTISASERSQTHALDRAANGTGSVNACRRRILVYLKCKANFALENSMQAQKGSRDTAPVFH